MFTALAAFWGGWEHKTCQKNSFWIRNKLWEKKFKTMMTFSSWEDFCVNYRTIYHYYFQGWEFALWFLKRMARFLWLKEQNSNWLFSKSESLQWLFKMSDGAKSNGSNLLLGIKRLKAVKKNLKSMVKATHFSSQLLVFWEWKSKSVICFQKMR